MATDDEKYLDKPGLGHLIGLVKGAIGTVQGAVDDLKQQVEDAGGVSVDNTTIQKSASGVLSAIMDVAGGVTSLAKHNADIVVDDGATTSKSGNAISVRAGGIQSSHLSNGCVTTDKIASKAVTSDKLADGSVGTSAIADDAVTGQKIDDGAVTSEKLNDLATLRGDMGLGYTLGALPISSGGTGATNVGDFVATLGLEALVDERIRSYNQALVGTYMYGEASFFAGSHSNPISANSLGNVSCSGFDYGTSDAFIKPQKTGVYEVSIAYNALFYDVVFGIDSNNMDTLRGYPSVLGKTVRFNLTAGTKYYLFAMTDENNNKSVKSDFTVNMVA